MRIIIIKKKINESLFAAFMSCRPPYALPEKKNDKILSVSSYNYSDIRLYRIALILVAIALYVNGRGILTGYLVIHKTWTFCVQLKGINI